MPSGWKKTGSTSFIGHDARSRQIFARFGIGLIQAGRGIFQRFFLSRRESGLLCRWHFNPPKQQFFAEGIEAYHSPCARYQRPSHCKLWLWVTLNFG